MDGTKILTQEWGNQMLIFLYDEAGSPVGFQYRNSTYDIEQYDTYWYRKNLQGDIVAIYDAYGIQLVSYRYDAWGNFVVSYQNNGVLTNAIHNPFTYRGYYYDSETGFYYLNSRYYDPATCRFINADSQLNTNSLLGYNQYAYCENNPVNRIDPTGHAAEGLLALWASSLNPVGWIVAAVVVAVVVTVVVYAACRLVEETAEVVKDTVEKIDNIVNAENQSVYVLTDSDNKVRYVGRTNDPARREYEHKHDPRHKERKDYTMKVVATGFTIQEAKVVEQILISSYTMTYLENARREIAVGNLAGYNDYIGAAIQIFEGVAEDELRNLMGR